MNARVFVEKKEGFQTEAISMFVSLKENFELKAQSMRIVNIYDVFNIDEATLELAKSTVFSEPVTDIILDKINEAMDKMVVLETLPGQYDQRADSVMQCVKLLNPSSECKITCGKMYIFDTRLTCIERELVEGYLVNPIESRLKKLSSLAVDASVEVTPLMVFTNFIDLDEMALETLRKQLGLAMSHEDILLVRAYFKLTEKRNPLETEIKVLDTYWSDHCRHTTFETCLKEVKITNARFKESIQSAFDLYLAMRTRNSRDEKPMTLMDLATINARDLRNRGLADEVEVSEEINACSVYMDVDHEGSTEKWLLMFKNETHNHPTEIEPFGGASTCIGGAIRDPLSGRSYVYQAMRVSGCGDVLAPIENTIPGKLPQKIISKKASLGNSSYGNQIGLPTTHVREIYHDSYVAKHMEVGAVVAAAPLENVVRLSPSVGDVIILLGGRTGRDGIGGATGSSKEHNLSSLEVCASEVQKGNAPEERKIQRLFRNSECTKLIKKCNDFGAGGVCVAIGELADGLRIDLDKVRTKYAGLNATEIAISESQERMAVVVAKEDSARFIELAENENLEAYEVAVVTKEARLVMSYHDEIVVDLSRAFIDTSGVRQNACVEIASSDAKNPFETIECSSANILKMMADKNVACQKGLIEMFDASIGSTTVLMPFGGKTQLTPTQASVQKIPVLDGKTKTCSVLTYGFEPEINEYSCFMGAQNAIVSSIAKTIAVGGSLRNVHFSFQEYFERLNQNPTSWGKVFEALLGACAILDKFQLAAIGGKDSMSGTFNEMNVVPTLISFACSHTSVDRIITPQLKRSGNRLYLISPQTDYSKGFDLDAMASVFELVEKLIADKKIISAYALEKGGVLASLFKMSFGNRLGFSIKGEGLLDFKPASFVVEVQDELKGDYISELGYVCEAHYKINNVVLDSEKVFKAWSGVFENLYPMISRSTRNLLPLQDCSVTKTFKSKNPVDQVNVLIPVFPGSNCEYDTARAFEEEGAKATIFVFRNNTEAMIFDSIKKMVELLDNSQILALPGGFSSGDEPDGSAKFIVNVLQNDDIKNAVHRLIDRDGLILGICNGFQALVKSGLLPTGRIQAVDEQAPTLFRNDINRHISQIVSTRVASVNSPWLSHLKVGEVYNVAVSHGEGKFMAEDDLVQDLFDRGCVAFQYCDEFGKLTMDSHYNVNGSISAIEGIVSYDGHVLGKMGHSERYFEDVFKNIEGNKKQNIFKSGVDYFRK